MFNNVMDFLQLVFAFINAPLFAAFLMGMFTRRTTGHGAFWGLIAGTGSAAVVHGLTQPVGATSLIKGGWLGTVVHQFPSEMAQNFWVAIFAFSVALVVTIVVSLATKRNKTDAELKGLVYSLTPKVVDDSKHWYQTPTFMAIIVGIIAIVLSIIFW
jgi:SSS family solute:Na+ symporter